MLVKGLIGKGPSESSYSTWDRDTKHRRQAFLRKIFPEIWPGNNGPLPWRLSRDELLFLENRMSRVRWPHYMERLYYKGLPFACNNQVISPVIITTLLNQVILAGLEKAACGKRAVNTDFSFSCSLHNFAIMFRQYIARSSSLCGQCED